MLHLEMNNLVKECNKQTNMLDIALEIHHSTTRASIDDILGVSKSLSILAKKSGITIPNVNHEDIYNDPYTSIAICQEGLGAIVSNIVKFIKALWGKMVTIFRKLVEWIMNLFKSNKIKNDLLKAIDAIKIAGDSIMDATSTGFENLDVYAATAFEYIEAKYNAIKNSNVIDNIINDNYRMAKETEEKQQFNQESNMIATWVNDGKSLQEKREFLKTMVKAEAKLIDIFKLVTKVKQLDKACTIDKVSHDDIFVIFNSYDLRTKTADIMGMFIDVNNNNAIVPFKLDKVPILDVYATVPKIRNFQSQAQKACHNILDHYNIMVAYSKDFLLGPSKRMGDFVNGNFISKLDSRSVIVQKLVGDNMKVGFNYLNAQGRYLTSFNTDVKGLVTMVSRVTNTGIVTGTDIQNDISSNFGYGNIDGILV